MENINWNTQEDWRNAQPSIIEDNEEYTIYEALDRDDRPMYAQQLPDDPDPKEEEEDEEEEDQDKDWGHIDPAEGNSPYPDPMDPSGPGSAV